MSSDLFSIERVLPEQFFDDTNQDTVGERRLMLAILQDACLCAAGSTKSADSALLAREAIDWIESTCDFDVHSFASICLHLGFDEATLRKKILAILPRRRRAAPRERRAVIVSLAERLHNGE